jgi:hypothetical protein
LRWLCWRRRGSREAREGTGYPDKKGFAREVGGSRPGRIRRSNNTHRRLLIPLISGVSTRSVCLVSGLVTAKLRRYRDICVRGRANGACRRRSDGRSRRCERRRGCLSYRTLDWWPRGRYTRGTSKCTCGSCLRRPFSRVLPIRPLWLRSPLCELSRKMHIAHTERNRTRIGTQKAINHYQATLCH